MAIDHGHTTLLMHFDDAGATFVDEAGLTFNVNGGAANSVNQSKFGGRSLYLDGAGDYLSSFYGTYPKYYFAGDPFTIDCWVYVVAPPAVSGDFKSIISLYASTTNYWRLGIYNNGGTMQWDFTVHNSTVQIQLQCNVSGELTGSWIHLALTREGNDFYIYQNGVQVGTVNDSSVVHQVNGYLNIGTWYGAYGNSFYGYIDELRIVKGLAAYPNAAAPFTPPSLPYGTMPADDDYTKMLLHFNSFDQADHFLDQTGRHALTTSGAVIATAQKKFGVSSVNTTSQNVLCGIHDDWIIGSQDFTCDFWARSNTLPSGTYQKLFAHNYAAVADWTGMQIRESGGTYYLEYIHYLTTPQISISSAITITTGTWHHYAITKSGNNFRLFYDGVLMATLNTAVSVSGQNASAAMHISGHASAQYTFNGWIDEFRWSVGIARWTADFSGSLPAAPYPSTLNLSETITAQDLFDAASTLISFTIPILEADFNLEVNSGANIDLLIPLPSGAITGLTGAVSSIAAEISQSFEASMLGAGSLSLDLPFPALDVHNLTGEILRIDALFEPVVPSFHVASEILGVADLTIPRLAIALAGSGEILGRIAGSLPSLTTLHRASLDARGSLDFELPALFYDSVLLHNGIITLDADLPVLLFNSFGTLETAILSYKTILINTKHYGVTEYNDCAYRQIVNFQNKIIASQGTDLVVLESSLDDGSYIPMKIKTGTLSFDRPSMILPKDVWITLRSGKKIKLTIHADEGPEGTEYSYISENFDPTLRKTRVKLGRGFDNRYYDFTVENVDGEFLSIDAVEIYSAKSKAT